MDYRQRIVTTAAAVNADQFLVEVTCPLELVIHLETPCSRYRPDERDQDSGLIGIQPTQCHVHDIFNRVIKSAAMLP